MAYDPLSWYFMCFVGTVHSWVIVLRPPPVFCSARAHGEIGGEWPKIGWIEIKTGWIWRLIDRCRWAHRTSCSKQIPNFFFDFLVQISRNWRLTFFSLISWCKWHGMVIRWYNTCNITCFAERSSMADFWWNSADLSASSTEFQFSRIFLLLLRPKQVSAKFYWIFWILRKPAGSLASDFFLPPNS
jgi:hypothetical protein